MSTIPDESLIQNLRDYRLWLNELRGIQQIGADSLVLFSNQSGATVDSGRTIAAGGSQTFRLSFASDVQTYPFATLDLIFYRDAVGTIYIPRTRVEERTVTAPGITTWDVTVDNDDDLASHTFYVKNIVNSTDRGVIS